MTIEEEFDQAIDAYLNTYRTNPAAVCAHSTKIDALVNSNSYTHYRVTTGLVYGFSNQYFYRGVPLEADNTYGPHMIYCKPHMSNTATFPPAQLPDYPSPDYMFTTGSRWESPKCECGAEKVGSQLHSKWCPKN